MNESNLDKSLIELCKSKTLDTINQAVHQTIEGEVFICYPTTKTETEKLHLIIDTQKKFDFFELAKLTNTIIEALGGDMYDDNDWLIIQVKSLFDEDNFNKLFVGLTPLSKEYSTEIISFITKYYPKATIAQSTAQQLNPSSIQTEMSSPSLKIELLAYLKANSNLWNRLVISSGAWDSTQQEIKDVLQTEAARMSSTITPRGTAS